MPAAWNGRGGSSCWRPADSWATSCSAWPTTRRTGSSTRRNGSEWSPRPWPVGFLVAQVVVPDNRSLLAMNLALMVVQIVVGVLGFALHARGNLSNQAGSLWDRFVYGLPIFAPLLFADLALLAVLGWLGAVAQPSRRSGRPRDSRRDPVGDWPYPWLAEIICVHSNGCPVRLLVWQVRNARLAESFGGHQCPGSLRSPGRVECQFEVEAVGLLDQLERRIELRS